MQPSTCCYHTVTSIPRRSQTFHSSCLSRDYSFTAHLFLPLGSEHIPSTKHCEQVLWIHQLLKLTWPLQWQQPQSSGKRKVIEWMLISWTCHQPLGKRLEDLSLRNLLAQKGNRKALSPKAAQGNGPTRFIMVTYITHSQLLSECRTLNMSQKPKISGLWYVCVNTIKM